MYNHTYTVIKNERIYVGNTCIVVCLS